jgi:hypothetical protein
LHSEAASVVQAMRELIDSTAQMIATFGCSMPRTSARSIAFWQMSRLVSSVGGDVDRRVGDDQQFVVGRHVHQEGMRDAPLGAQPGIG